MTDLHGRRRAGVSLDEALAWAAVTGIGLLTSPIAYVVAVVEHRSCRIPDGDADLTDVYEARVFSPAKELRWWRPAHGEGTAVVLAEDPQLLPETGTPIATLHADQCLDNGYLLWGRTVYGAPRGWSALATRRIGTILVPLEPAATVGGRIRITAREYLASEPEHGNAYVAEERLLALKHIAMPEGGEE